MATATITRDPRIEEYTQKLLAQAPPMTPERLARITALFRAGAST